VKPTLFIGSSTEAMCIVDAFHSHLEVSVEVIPWKFGIFQSGESALESLVNALGRFDFAAFILTPDDLVESRGLAQGSPRDNVIFEMGLFIGRLGRERVFVLHERYVDLKIPTDLLGINTVSFGGRSSDNFDALLRATRPAFRTLEVRMKTLGLFSGINSDKVTRHGLLDYSDSFRGREGHYRDVVEHATETLFINGTALNNIASNSWGKLVERSKDVQINLLMLDPSLANDATAAQLFETTYRDGVLGAAQATFEKITHQIRQLPEAQRQNIRLYLTKFFMPIAAVVADPTSEEGMMVVEVIGGSDPNVEYFSRPRYVLTAASTEVGMFKGYWSQVSYLFGPKRSTLHKMG
jgi:hypothetical protein